MSLIRRTWQEFRTAPWAYLTATLVIALGLAVFSFFGLVYFNLVHFTEQVAQELVLNVYLNPGSTKEEARAVIEELEAYPLVAKVSYLSAEEVLKDLEKLFEEKDLLAGVSPEFLPPVLLVSFKDPFRASQHLKKLSAKIAALPGVYKVQFAKSWLVRLANLKRFLEIMSLAGLVLIGLATCFIIALVVRLSLSQRQKELEVLSLVGATPGFIQGPIVVMAALEGAVASFLALCLVYLLKFYLDGVLRDFFPTASGALLFWGRTELIILIAGVILLCVTGSYWASRRYLRY
ncbi:MAG TPA: FtsX-like permease family protein [Thermodesulfatator atlanticus]|uniref:Cell division protein FtsX n=1 Tax=Thermodesulfatator atlanticus TaxID=501497 RepID=A0A7V5NZ43_9BACT|nr:FtsX-like permease family protein [Thermodesulfatator atlanticus]